MQVAGLQLLEAVRGKLVRREALLAQRLASAHTAEKLLHYHSNVDRVIAAQRKIRRWLARRRSGNAAGMLMKVRVVACANCLFG